MLMTKASKNLNQAEIEQATGLSREVLRKWELRFAFPVPLRDAQGQRLYAPQDVTKLQHIQRLLARGHKPRNVLTLSLKALQALLAAGVSADGALVLDNPSLATELLNTLSAGQPPHAVDEFLQLRVRQVGLDHFAQTDIPLFNAAIGEAWKEGRLGIHGEHRYTQAVDHLVQRCLADLLPAPSGRKVLLTTPPDEAHGIGLLAFQATLALRGAQCTSLGTQTPAASVAEAVAAWDIAIVCLSASAGYSAKALGSYLRALRKLLPAHCELWLGGGAALALAKKPIPGVLVFTEVPSALAHWDDRSP